MTIAAHMLLEAPGATAVAPFPPASPGMVAASPGMVTGEGFLVLLQALLGDGGEPGGATGVTEATDDATDATDANGTAEPGEKHDDEGAVAGPHQPVLMPAAPATPAASATPATPAAPATPATPAAPATPATPAAPAAPATHPVSFSGATHVHQGVTPSLPANDQPGIAAEAPALAGVPVEPGEMVPPGADVERTGIKAFTGGIAAVPEGDMGIAGTGTGTGGTGGGGVAVRMPVDIEELAEKFLAYARVRATADGATVRLSLKPEHLGDLNLDLHWRGNSLEARFLVHNQEALAAVQSQLGRLEEGLRAQGINVGSLEALMWQAGGAGGDHPFSGRWRDRRGKDLGSTGAGVVGVSGAGARNRSPGRLTMAPVLVGGLNYLA